MLYVDLCRPARLDSFGSFVKSAFLTPFDCEFELGVNRKVIDLWIPFPKHIFNLQSEHWGLRYDFSKKVSPYFRLSNPHFNPLLYSFFKARSNTVNTPNHCQSTYNYSNMWWRPLFRERDTKQHKTLITKLKSVKSNSKNTMKNIQNRKTSIGRLSESDVGS